MELNWTDGISSCMVKIHCMNVTELSNTCGLRVGFLLDFVGIELFNVLNYKSIFQNIGFGFVVLFDC